MKVEELLLDNDILDIFIGDRNIRNDFIYQLSMPHLTGKNICDLANNLGLEMTYNTGIYQGYSRRQYMQALIRYCINENKISELFNEITDKRKFKFLTDDYFYYIGDANSKYNQMIGDFFDSINKLLNFENAYLIHSNNFWRVASFNENIKIELPKKDIDMEFIDSEYNNIQKNICEKDYNHAITLCRTLVEEVFIKMLTKKNVKFDQNGDIRYYYKLVRENYNLKTGTDIDKSLNKLLTGLSNIIDAITEIRNKAGDSHAFLNKNYNLEEYYIRLMANASVTISEFLLETMKSDKE